MVGADLPNIFNSFFSQFVKSDFSGNVSMLRQSPNPRKNLIRTIPGLHTVEEGQIKKNCWPGCNLWAYIALLCRPAQWCVHKNVSDVCRLWTENIQHILCPKIQKPKRFKWFPTSCTNFTSDEIFWENPGCHFPNWWQIGSTAACSPSYLTYRWCKDFLDILFFAPWKLNFLFSC